MVEDFFKWVYLGKVFFHFSYVRKYFFLHELLALWATTLWAEQKQGSFVTFKLSSVPPIWQSGKRRTKGCFQQTPASGKAFRFPTNSESA